MLSSLFKISPAVKSVAARITSSGRGKISIVPAGHKKKKGRKEKKERKKEKMPFSFRAKGEKTLNKKKEFLTLNL